DAGGHSGSGPAGLLPFSATSLHRRSSYSCIMVAVEAGVLSVRLVQLPTFDVDSSSQTQRPRAAAIASGRGWAHFQCPVPILRGGSAVNDKIAIIGAGPLASILAHRIPSSARKVIIGRPKAAAVALADEVGGIASDQVSAVRGCRVVFLAVATPEVPQTVADI